MKRRGTHATTGMVKQQEDKQKRRSEVVNFERRWWLKGKKMDRDSKERGGRGEAVKGLRRKGLDYFFFKDERESVTGEDVVGISNHGPLLSWAS